MHRTLHLLAIFCTVLMVTGCRDDKPELTLEQALEQTAEQIKKELTESKTIAKQIVKEVNASGTITDEQAKFLGENSIFFLELDGLTAITDVQTQSLSKIPTLSLNGLTSITDQQAESLSNAKWLYLNGLTSITEHQAESLSKVQSLEISEDLQPLINKYKNQ